MKSKEEIERLGKQSAQKKYRLQHIPLGQIDEYGSEIKDYVTIFVDGYTQCQEDMADKMNNVMETLLKIRECKDYGNNSSSLAKELIESLNKGD